MQNARLRLNRRGDLRSWRLATKLLFTTAIVMIVLTVAINLLVALMGFRDAALAK